MKTVTRYRLLRTISGVTHFARIEISTTPPRARSKIPPLWFAGALRGIEDASRALGLRHRWWIQSFAGSWPDTFDSDAWAAGAMAVLDAHHAEASLSFRRDWVIVLASGEQLSARGPHPDPLPLTGEGVSVDSDA